MKNLYFTCFFCLFFFINLKSQTNECYNWKIRHPEWIFCDDFESNEPLVKIGRYYEYSDNNGGFILKDSAGLNGTKGMEATWEQGMVEAGNIKVSFGRNPNAYINRQNINPNEDYREIYYRMYLKLGENWEGAPAKLSRATIFMSADHWGQAMIAHLWSGADSCLVLDPASCVNSNGNVECTKYNDFANLNWLGIGPGKTPIFNSEYNDKWLCIEHHIKLNDPGQSNGLQEFWIDGNLEARRENLNFTGTFVEYGINAVMFENYWNNGAIRKISRYFDNIVISTEKIGEFTDVANVKQKDTKLNFKNSIYQLVGKHNYAKISIINLSGRNIKEVKVTEILQKRLDNVLKQFSKGIYFLKITLPEANYCYKIPLL